MDVFGFYVNYFCKDYDYVKVIKIVILFGKIIFGIKKLVYFEMCCFGKGKELL